MRTVGGFWSSLDPAARPTRRGCSARRGCRAFREVTLPLLGPPIAAAASIVFLFTFTAFGVVLLLADPAHATLEVEIYRQAVQLLDLPIAAALAFVQMVARDRAAARAGADAGTAGGRAAAGRGARRGPPAARARAASWSAA